MQRARDRTEKIVQERPESPGRRSRLAHCDYALAGMLNWKWFLGKSDEDVAAAIEGPSPQQSPPVIRLTLDTVIIQLAAWPIPISSYCSSLAGIKIATVPMRSIIVKPSLP